ncbi:MAG: glycerate kinase [Chloroflexi bacterium]|nr:glycerate kinase [Chloroflexota bacterium]
MKIVIAPQGFKGSLTGLEVARSIEKGVKAVFPDAITDLVPVADGGDGTLQSLVDATGGKVISTRVTDPLGREIYADWGSLGDGETAVIEMARSSGLALLALNELNPLATTTYGVGQLAKEALDSGHTRFIIGIGGSATNDGGAGMMEALGAKLLDSSGNPLPPGGAALANINKIDMSGLDQRFRDAHIEVACDVNNPLCGPDGASAVFGPQKGATPEMVEELDAALSQFASIIEHDLGSDIRTAPGAGAAGGLGAGLMAFANADLKAGVDIVLDAIDIDSHLVDADLVITGEGQIDHSTIFNKSPVGVAARAANLGIPVIAIAGGLGDGYREVHDLNIAATFSLVSGPMSLDDAIANSGSLLAGAAEEIMRAIVIGRALGD